MAENKFCCDYAKRGTAGCKKCKQKIEKGLFRIAKVVANPFSDDGGEMKQWFHPACLFETFQRARATTKVIENLDDIEGYTDLKQEDKELVNQLVAALPARKTATPKKKTPKKQSDTPTSKTPPASTATTPTTSAVTTTSKDKPESHTKAASVAKVPYSKDDAFREYRRLCSEIAAESSYNEKTNIVSRYLKKGSSGDGYTGDTYILLKLLLPGVIKRVYNINNRQLVKLFSQIFRANHAEMLKHLDKGDVAETIKVYFEESTSLPPQQKSDLTLHEIDDLLDEMTQMTKEDDQQRVLTKIARRCTANDLKMAIRLIKHDLRIYAGAKHIMDALDENGYAAFQASRDLRDVVNRVLDNRKQSNGKKLAVKATLMTPVLPMLAEACRSIGQAMKKCPNGMYSEIKYDGERVQVHKQGDKFQYYSRSLKPVLPHKIKHFKDFIPKAFPHGDDIILDSEVLLVDTNTSKPLPFGTLGVHKKAAFSDAQVCLFVFDCLHFNGENLMDKPIKERREILHRNMTEIPNRIMFSEMKFIKVPEDLQSMLTTVFKEGLEGLVLKDINSHYEPGKRHWLKVKKDYLHEGAMADTADLVVLGAYYGTGNKGGMMSVFLCGVYNPGTKKWCTVTKVGNGHDDETIGRLQTELDMVKISKAESKVPDWLNIKKNVLPDFVVADPKKAPVWEITGAEFSKADIHTADGISIRFPRVTKIRDDKSWKEATDLPRLKELFKISRENLDIPEPDIKGKIMSKNTPKKATPVKRERSPSTSDNNQPTKKSKQVSDEDSSDSMDLDTDSGPYTDIKPAIKKSPYKQEACKYGSTCFQTNPAHLEQFSHPTKGATSNEYSPLKSKVLLDIFHGMKIYLPKSVDNFDQLRRYIITYDGDVVTEYDKDTVTHIVNNGGKRENNGHATTITTDWLWRCIKKKSIVPFPDS